MGEPADEPFTGVAHLALGVAMVTQGRLEEAGRALDQAERTIRTEAEPTAGMRLHYGRGMLEFVSGRHDAALRAFQTAERLPGSLRCRRWLLPRRGAACRTDRIHTRRGCPNRLRLRPESC